MESKGDPLPVPMQTTSNNKTKTLKKEEQYKVSINESNLKHSYRFSLIFALNLLRSMSNLITLKCR